MNNLFAKGLKLHFLDFISTAMWLIQNADNLCWIG